MSAPAEGSARGATVSNDGGTAPLTDASPPAVHIVLLPGDGIGPEVAAAARTVFDAAAGRHGMTVTWQELTVGGAAIDRYGVPLRDDDIAACARADAVLLGAVGGPRWDDVDPEIRPERALLRLRAELGLFANLRPVTAWPALAGAAPLRPERLAGVDLLIVRELTGGIYFGRPSEQRTTAAGREAVDTLRYTEAEIRRVVRVAFGLAATRRRHLTSVDKANVLASSRLWRAVVDETAREFPDVEVEHRLVDAAAMLLVTQPLVFDVVVTENLFGDILSDEASVVVGSLGLLPSASLGSHRTRHGTFGMYEPIHGSAPDIAGRGIADPFGAILSAAMLARWSLGREDVASAIESAVAGAVADGFGTPDLGRYGTSAEVTAAVVERVESAASGKPAAPVVPVASESFTSHAVLAS